MWVKYWKCTCKIITGLATVASTKSSSFVYSYSHLVILMQNTSCFNEPTTRWKFIQLTICFVEIYQKSPLFTCFAWMSVYFWNMAVLWKQWRDFREIKSVFEKINYSQRRPKRQNSDMVFLYEIIIVCLVW